MNPIRRLWARLVGKKSAPSNRERRAIESRILYAKVPRPATPQSVRRPVQATPRNFDRQDEFAPSLTPVPADFSPAPRFSSAVQEVAERNRFVSGGDGVYDGAGASARWSESVPAASPAPSCSTWSTSDRSSTESTSYGSSDSGSCSSSDSSSSSGGSTD